MDRWKYGIYAVGMGLGVIVVSLAIVAWQYDNAADAGAVLAAVTGTVGAVVGAYFGVQVGSAGKEQADAQAIQMRDALTREKDKSQMLAGALPEDRALSILESLR